MERARFDKMLGSDQIGTLITALGTGIGQEEFDTDKLRYHKIIIMTDADVDGAHIRTLLLTFFFRQMPELIERGYLYIAQPPLYKVTQGKSERYLKDERALENYLIAGRPRGGRADARHRRGARGRRSARRRRRGAAGPPDLDGLHSRYDRATVEQAAIAGVLNPELMGNLEQATEAAAYIARRLDILSDETERGWTGTFDEARGLAFERMVRGVAEVHVIDPALISSADARRLDAHAASLQRPTRARPGSAARATETPIFGPRDLLDAVFAAGRKGIAMQRYKGLGEMNADQLWETTLDPKSARCCR